MRLVLEATCVYHQPLAEYAYTAGVTVFVTNPGRAAEHARSQNRLNKTDKLDAQGLQHYGRDLHNCHEHVPHSASVQALQALLSRLSQLNGDLRRERNRLEKAPFVPGSGALSASLKRHIKYLEKEKDRIQVQIDTLINEHDRLRHVQKRLLSIKGIGSLTSQALIPLLYRDQFTDARQLAAYLGLTPVHKHSGTSLHKRGRLSGRGNRDLRAQLYMPAVCASRYDPAMQARYRELIARGKAPKQALTAIMRKLVHVCYGVVKNDQDYQCPMAA
jgi:transposase